MKPNAARTCTGDIYCIINMTKLVQTGCGRKLKCPRCGTEYDPDEKDPNEYIGYDFRNLYKHMGR